MPPKRKAEPASSNGSSTKRSKPSKTAATDYDDDLRKPHPWAKLAEENGIVQRQFYPPEMSTDRARSYIEEGLLRPMEELIRTQRDCVDAIVKAKAGDAVVHWFKSDLRVSDNTALAMASDKAKEAGVPLIGIYLVSPQDFQAHLTAPIRVDFILRSLDVLQKDLAELDIPLYMETVDKRRDLPGRLVQLMADWGANHLYANLEYEVDELRRERKLIQTLADEGKSFNAVHDTCVVPPGTLKSGAGNQYAVYTPWYRSWMAHIHANLDLLDVFDAPAKNPAGTKNKLKSLFESKVPTAPKDKALTNEQAKRWHAMWPAGEHEAKKRLDKFCEERIAQYTDQRNIPAEQGTSNLSVHLAAGTLSARTCVRVARDGNKTKKLDGGIQGIVTWISEVAWRDFYRHVMVRWPQVCMNKPFKPEFANIEWVYDDDQFQAWCDGKTGYPIVDAAMRQLNHTGYMHNRCRMVVASFLSKDLLIDWRKGERYFMENLVDGDVPSNSGGWGWSAGVGVDPQPYFRIFNPLRQSERFDPQGAYIRKWVPELKDMNDKEVHEPYSRGAEAKAKKAGYPKPVVEHSAARVRALAAYKAATTSDM